MNIPVCGMWGMQHGALHTGTVDRVHELCLPTAPGRFELVSSSSADRINAVYRCMCTTL